MPFSKPYFPFLFVPLLTAPFCAVSLHAQDLNEIGVTLLRTFATNVDGTGIRVAQVEAEVATNPPTWEVAPANVNRPATLFAYFSADGSSAAYPNSLGDDSWHADAVGNNFYGLPAGVATNVIQVDNYEADFFFDDVIDVLFPTNISAPIVNQSFILGTDTPVSEQQESDSAYDNYAAKYGTLFLSGAGNGGTVNPPATCYNGIGVGVSDGTSSVGPTPDNGRCKPDIIAPGVVTSFSTPYTAGAAAVLLQAALRGDGGPHTNAAADLRILKALLLNGAVKPAGWTNAPFAPLDYRFGAGLLNLFNSYEQLVSGQHSYIVSASVATGSPHPPPAAAGAIAALSGWDSNSISSSAGGVLGGATDGVNHYFFNVTNCVSDASWFATVTLAWNRPASPSPNIHYGINNLGLFLYNAANSNLITVSTSTVDNVQHLFIPALPSGRYDLQVWKAGGSGIMSPSENYGLAWSFTSPALKISGSPPNLNLAWPLYPAGFTVAAATDLINAPWSVNLPAASFASGTNLISLPNPATPSFFRLREPDF